jgi:hypothetical protein
VIAPIETYFDGYRFRSRLEAKWAVFFKRSGIRYLYEPEAYPIAGDDCYLPDFWLPRYRCFFEVKYDTLDPNWTECASRADARIAADHSRNLPRILKKPYALSRATEQHCLIVFGDPLEHTLYLFEGYKAPLASVFGLLASIRDNYFARQYARCARFEFGETPRF